MVAAGELERGRQGQILKAPRGRGVDVRSYSGPDESVVFGNALSGSPPSGLAYLSLIRASL